MKACIKQRYLHAFTPSDLLIGIAIRDGSSKINFYPVRHYDTLASVDYIGEFAHQFITSEYLARCTFAFGLNL